MWKNLVDTVQIIQKWAEGNSFYAGFCTGILFILVLAIVILIVRLLMRTRRVSQLTFEGKNGITEIKADAVDDLVDSLKTEFSNLRIRRTVLLQKHGKRYISVSAEFIQGTTTLPETVEHFQDRVLEMLKETFGISSVREVRMKILTTQGKPSGAVQPAPNADADVLKKDIEKMPDRPFADL